MNAISSLPPENGAGCAAMNAALVCKQFERHQQVFNGGIRLPISFDRGVRCSSE
jgi:hypothetical protein